MTTTIDIERRGFLNAIIAEPEEDTHRLVYADWLEDHGEIERAELIRWMIDNPEGYFQPFRDCVEMAFRFTKDPVRQYWHALDNNHSSWFQFDYSLFLCTAWNRGFCSIVEWDWQDWNAHADQITQEHPIEEVRLLTMPGVCADDEGNYKFVCCLDNRPDVLVPLTNWAENRLQLLKLNWPRIKFTLPDPEPVLAEASLPLVSQDNHLWDESPP